MPDDIACVAIPDDQLEARIKVLASGERRALAVLLLHIAEFDRRRLYERAGFRTLWDYCVRELAYSESAALKRIVAARLLQRFPALLALIDEGAIHLSALVVLSPHLTQENHIALLERAKGMSKRELQFLAAGFSPRPDAPDILRRLGPAGGPGPTIEPLCADRALVRFTAGRAFLSLLERAREVLRHALPDGGLEGLLTEALERLLDARDPLRSIARRKRRAAAGRIRCSGNAEGPAKRRIPTPIRDEVFLRDEGRCTFVGSKGRRCEARGGLEVDHIIPWAMGGRSDDMANLRLLCREHNQSEARRIFGGAFVDARIRQEKPTL